MKYRDALHVGTSPSTCSSLLLPLSACAMLLAACGSSGKLPKSQVVANVNDREITISQLNQALQTLDPPAVTAAITKNAVDSLIDEELLVQGALNDKLDREPATMQAIEDARRQVLARAYAERHVWPKTAPSLAEEEKYYRDNPLLFQRRKVYELMVYTIPSTAMNDVLREDLDRTHSSDEVRAVLEKHDVKFETQQIEAGAEILPSTELATLDQANVGDLVTVASQDAKIALNSIQKVVEKPMSFERARAAIEDYLVTTRRREATLAYLKHEKAVSKISYAAEFASTQPPSAVRR